MKELKLKPCPFCGNKPSLSKYDDESLWSHNTVEWSSIFCSNCDYIMNFCEDPDYLQAIKTWNTRKNNWISVKNMLPDYDQEVYCYDNLLKQRFEAIYQNGFYTIELKLKLDATHWQPLPAPPEVKCQ